MQQIAPKEEPAPPQALSGIRVIDLSQNIAGPFCTKLLADYGADVVKVEPLGGDAARRMGPFYKDQPHPEHSGLFMHLNTNKRGVTLNLDSATGRKVLRELAKDADAMIEDLGPGAVERLGLGYDILRKLNLRLVVTSISDFGRTGPYRDYKAVEMMYYAMGGPMYATGDPEREPMKTGGNVSQYQAGSAAALATMTALFAAELQGKGAHIDLSIMETQLGSIDRRSSRLLGYQYTGVVGPRSLDIFGIGSGPHPCKDGWINLLGGEFGFERMCAMIGRPELIEDDRFSTREAQAQSGSVEAFEEYYLPWLLERTKQEVWSQAQDFRIPSGVINTTEDLLADVNFRERDVWAEANHPVVGRVTQPGRPFIMYRTPWRLRRPAPTLGQHNQEVLCGELGFSKSELVVLKESGAI
ncbi:MAG: CaiB/BaiF CoA transferase family protein [Dehalococcoidia bacterium]